MNSHLDRINFNLLIILHYASKALWLALAAVFGIIGYKLYALGVQQTGKAEFGFPGVLSFKADTAGPGLIVMVFALACTVTGVIRTKIRIGKDELNILGAVPSEASREKEDAANLNRECKLFSSLLCYLAEESSAFVILNSHAQIDIESLAWATVPQDLRKLAVSAGSELVLSKVKHPFDWTGSVGSWNVHCKIAQIVDTASTWCVVSVTTSELDYQVNIAREDSRPIFG